jgi:hypothetical protein
LSAAKVAIQSFYKTSESYFASENARQISALSEKTKVLLIKSL